MAAWRENGSNSVSSFRLFDLILEPSILRDTQGRASLSRTSGTSSGATHTLVLFRQLRGINNFKFLEFCFENSFWKSEQVMAVLTWSLGWEGGGGGVERTSLGLPLPDGVWVIT
jgi:hypothetical protein